MILVDTSVWIELLGGRGNRIGPDDLLGCATCAPVVQEVFQGLRISPDSEAFRSAFLAVPCLSDPLELRLFLAAAEIYREGRRRGYAIRSSADCLIAAIAIDNRVPVWHRERDFSFIARYTPLRAVEWR